MADSARDIVPRAVKQIPAEMAEYFLCFSVFEKCLKERDSRYLTILSGGGFKVNHSTFFSEVLRDSNDLSAKIMELSPVIRSKPPRKQIFADGRVGFNMLQSRRMNAADVLDALPRIRNNLFHGGKWPSGPEDESARDRDLLREATDILLLVLDWCVSSEDSDLAAVGREFRHGLAKLAAA